VNYNVNQITSFINQYQKNNYFIIQINKDEALNQIVLKRITKSIDILSKSKEIELDYCFSPVNELLIFNLVVLTNFSYDEVEKFNSQLYVTENGIYIINKSGFKEISDAIIAKFKFDHLNYNEFTEKLLINLYAEDIMQPNKKKTTMGFSVSSKAKHFTENLKIGQHRTSLSGTKSKQHTNNFPLLSTPSESKVSHNRPRKYSIEDLIYWILNISICKLEDFTLEIEKEAQSLKGIYLDITDQEKGDFQQRIDIAEKSIQIIQNEVICKKNFFEYMITHFKLYNKLAQHKYFKKSFNFLLELMVARAKQIELKLDQINVIITMIKDNYGIVVQDSIETRTNNLNKIVFCITFLTVFYIPINVISGIFGMNVLNPFRNYTNLYPFWFLIFLKIFFFLLHFAVFAWWGWI